MRNYFEKFSGALAASKKMLGAALPMGARAGRFLSLKATRGRLLALFATVFFLQLIATFPANVFKWAASQAGVSIVSATGTIWRANFEGIFLGTEYLETAQFRAKPWSLLRGELSGDVKASGETMSIRSDSAYATLHHIGAARLNLRAVNKLYYRGLRTPYRISLDATNIMVDGEGVCLEGSGDIEIDVDDETIAQVLGKKLSLRGNFECTEKQIVFLLNPTGDLVAMISGSIVKNELVANISLTVPDKYRNSPATNLFLSRFGFEAVGDQHKTILREVFIDG